MSPAKVRSHEGVVSIGTPRAAVRSAVGYRTAVGSDEGEPRFDAAPREYTLAQYWQADGGVSFSATVNIGSELVTTTAAGWTTSTLTLPPTGLEGSAKVTITGGSGYAYLRALQLFRKV